MTLHVYIPSPLRSYTGGVALVEGRGDTLAELLLALDERYPGIRFRIIDEQDRIREHIRFFVGVELVREITQPIAADQDVHIVCALSGG